MSLKFDARDWILVMGDFYVKLSNVAVDTVIGRHGLFSYVNENGEQLVDFFLSYKFAISHIIKIVLRTED